jgi:ATPase subunit of ABC transporter with duplicated ATPase domains
MDDPKDSAQALLNALTEAERAVRTSLRDLQQRTARQPQPARHAAWRRLADSMTQLQQWSIASRASVPPSA